MSLTVANEQASLPVAHRLFLPQSWACDRERRRKAKVPEEIAFQAKTEIALEQMQAALAAGITKGIVLADAGYGSGAEFRSAITALGLAYCLGIRPMLTVWRPGEAPPARPRKSKRGPWRKGEGPAKHPHAPIQVEDLARELPAKAWQTISWREGTNAPLSGRFARLRINCAPGGGGVTADPAPEEWLLIEWPESDEKPLRFWLSTLPPETSFAELVRLTKLRWRIERDFLDLKQECGLGHYEGRGGPRLPPPYQPVHRGLRIPDRPNRDDSPLSQALAIAPPRASPSHRLSTPRRRRCARNATCPAPSPPCTKG